MSKFIVVCSLPNAGEIINGVKFESGSRGQSFSEPVDEAVAARFAAIPGFTMVQHGKPAADKKPAAVKDSESGGTSDEAGDAPEESGATSEDKAEEATQEAPQAETKPATRGKAK